MTKKRNGFFALCFSLVPGAGEMYMGFMKQGVSIMAAFWLLIFLAAFLNIGPVLFILPILWCYSFFNVHNIRGLSDDEFYALEDDYAFHMEKFLPVGSTSRKHSTFGAAALIILGVMMLWNNMMEFLRWLIPSPLYWTITEGLPQIFIGLALVFTGLYLIRGKKKELDEKIQQEKIEEQEGMWK